MISLLPRVDARDLALLTRSHFCIAQSFVLRGQSPGSRKAVLRWRAKATPRHITTATRLGSALGGDLRAFNVTARRATSRKRRSVSVWRSPSRTLSSTTSDGSPIDLPATDKKWQRLWEDRPIGERSRGQKDDTTREKAYILPMFPYPSGNLHMGHVRVYTISDVLSRWKHMTGHKIFNPMGWDAFGLPAENAAIERGINPTVWTGDNIVKMKALMKSMNTDFMWSKELSTCNPSFYKHTQKLFLLFYEHGLAYQAEGLVNWDPVDKTVLANEQVDKEGNSWRSGAKVEQKSLTQWFLKTTRFQESLLQDLDLLSKDGNWPENVLAMQRNWLGRSAGAKFTFMLKSATGTLSERHKVEVFSTRPETIFGVQFLALSTSHPIVLERIATNRRLQDFVEAAALMPEKTKAGFLLEDVFAMNPVADLSGSLDSVKAPIPIYVAPYVLQDYGEGAIMGVPGHDERDSTFWRTNRPSEQIRRVVIPPDTDALEIETEKPFTGDGILSDHCGTFAQLPSREASTRIVEELARTGAACETESWRLQDWLISRQRSWGTPIPIIHCKSCGSVPVPDEELPVQLPDLDGEWFKGRQGNPLEQASEWLNVACPKCRRPSKRETDTMDTFVDSSWYYMRFTDPLNQNLIFSPAAVNSLLPVDIYIGGVEHAILHLLYARFVSKFLTSIGLWPDGHTSKYSGEPFSNLISQGMVHGKTYTEPLTGRFLHPDEIDLTTPSEPKIKASGAEPVVSYQKMSKSKYNGVDPSGCINKFGADVIRAHVLFAAPVTEILNWDDTKIIGIQRWLGRIWRHTVALRSRLETIGQDFQAILSLPTIESTELNGVQQDAWYETQQHISHVWHAYQSVSLNTLVSHLMKLTQHVLSHDGHNLNLDCLQTSILLRVLAPVAPAFAGECWESLNDVQQSRVDRKLSLDIFDEPFPKPDAEMSERKGQKCAVQENGKFRFTVDLPILSSEYTGDKTDWVLQRLLETEIGSAWLNKHSGKQWDRIIVIKAGKTINFVG